MWLSHLVEQSTYVQACVHTVLPPQFEQLHSTMTCPGANNCRFNSCHMHRVQNCSSNIPEQHHLRAAKFELATHPASCKIHVSRFQCTWPQPHSKHKMAAAAAVPKQPAPNCQPKAPGQPNTKPLQHVMHHSQFCRYT
jgi:hypothetical protein